MTFVSDSWKRTSRCFLSSTVLAVSIGIIGVCVYQGTAWFGERFVPIANESEVQTSILQMTRAEAPSVTRQLQGFLDEQPQHGGFIGEEAEESQESDSAPENDSPLMNELSDTNETKPEVDLLTDADLGLWENGFQIKLYWEQGYKWQNETRERKCKSYYKKDTAHEQSRL